MGKNKQDPENRTRTHLIDWMEVENVNCVRVEEKG